MFGLVDCNNFYASCERAFNPGLIGKPIIVLSNNDGCVISRSNEAKALGVPMGAPEFKCKELVEKHHIAVFSSNYILYGDMSQRVMTTLAEFSPDIEIYSIDEAFLQFNGFEKINLADYGRTIVNSTTRNTGIPVSMGIAPTKTLAKLANKMAKKNPDNKNFCLLNNSSEIINALKLFSVSDVWGIGRQHTTLLKKNNMFSAYDFTQASRAWVRKNMTVVGERMWEELQGTPAIALEQDIPAKKQICTSRSFGEMITEFEPLSEAVANHAASCALKLRKQKSCASVIMVFIHTNQFRKDLPQYYKNTMIQLPVATNSSMEIVEYATLGLKEIYKKGYKYKKAGVIITEIVSEKNLQGSLFDAVDRAKHHKALMAMDAMNQKYGNNKVRIASQGYSKSWKLRQEKLSPLYTTRLEDIITVKAK